MTPAAVTSPAADDGPPRRLSFASVVSGAVVVSLVRPLTWALGLASFLAGGGLVLVTTPVLVLPTPTGLQNALGAPVSTLVFGGPSSGLVGPRRRSGPSRCGALFLVAVVVGAWAEREAIPVALDAAGDEGLLPPTDLAGAAGVAPVAGVRLLGLVPVVVVLLAALPAVYAAAYHQLVLPDELVTPLPLRVIARVPGQLVALGLTWLLADAAAAVGVRRLVLERRTRPGGVGPRLGVARPATPARPRHAGRRDRRPRRPPRAVPRRGDDGLGTRPRRAARRASMRRWWP